MFLLLLSLASIASCTLAFTVLQSTPLSSCCSNAGGRSRHREPSSSSLALFPGLEQVGEEGISRISPEAGFDFSLLLGLEGLGLEGFNLALALTSAAAAGAASQFPRILALEADRNRMNAELKQGQENLNAVSLFVKYLVQYFHHCLFYSVVYSSHHYCATCNLKVGKRRIESKSGTIGRQSIPNGSRV